MKLLYRFLAVFLCFMLILTALPVYALSEYQASNLIISYANGMHYSYGDVFIESDFGGYPESANRVVILGIKSEERVDEPYDIQIGGLTFRFSSKAYADRFLFYRWQGSLGYNRFMSVKDAYERGYLTSKAIYDIALQHGVDTYAPEELKVKEGEIEWSFDPVAEKLTVDGSGKMPDYRIINGVTDSPAAKWRYDIRHIKVDSVQSVGSAAFYNLDNLISVEIDSPQTIGSNAFAECDALTAAELRWACNIGERAFYNCEKLSSLKLSKKLRIIGKNAFEGCRALTEFDFPQGIREVRNDAFKACDSIEKMSFCGKAPKLYEGMLKDFKGEILYPDNSPFWNEQVCKGYSKTAKWTAFDAPKIKLVDNYFEDLHPYGWYLSGIQYCYDSGIMQGMGNYRFEPNQSVTREQVAMILYNYLNADDTYTSYSFDDVVPGAWYADAVEWMYQNGYTKGISRDKFGVGRYVTRQDLITLIYNVIFRDYEIQYSLGEYHCKGGIKSFSDACDVSDYAYNAIRFAVEVYDSSLCRGPGEIYPILYGNNGKLNPKDTCTRAEAAAIIQRSFYADYFSPVSKVTGPTS